jgi:hypothetical protein
LLACATLVMQFLSGCLRSSAALLCACGTWASSGALQVWPVCLRVHFITLYYMLYSNKSGTPVRSQWEAHRGRNRISCHCHLRHQTNKPKRTRATPCAESADVCRGDCACHQCSCGTWASSAAYRCGKRAQLCWEIWIPVCKGLQHCVGMRVHGVSCDCGTWASSAAMSGVLGCLAYATSCARVCRSVWG